MRGVKSFAMVLCVSFSQDTRNDYELMPCLFFFIKATHKDGKEAGIELVQPPTDSKIGDRVYFEGEKYESMSFCSN